MILNRILKVLFFFFFPINKLFIKILPPNKFKKKHKSFLRSQISNYPIDKKFRAFYSLGLWIEGKSLSGEGSEIAYTKNLRNFLIEIIDFYKYKRIVDIPCGDFHWFSLITDSIKIDEYWGYDVVDKLIQENNRNYQNSKYNFAVKNALTENIESCELLIVRDFLFHLSFKDLKSFSINIRNWDFKFILVSTHTDTEDCNQDIITGNFRKLNLFEKPFKLKSKNIITFVEDYPEGYFLKRKMVLLSKKSFIQGFCLNEAK